MKKHLNEIRKLLKITIPIVLAQISQMSMSLVNNITIRHFNNIDIAAISIGISIWSPIILFGHGILLSLVPTISYMYGSKKNDRIPKYIINTYWLATLLSIIIMIFLWHANFIIHMIKDINPIIEDKSIQYIRILLWSTPGYLYFQVIQNQCEGFLKPKPAMIIGLFGLIFNIIINYILTFKKIIWLNYGINGCGISTIIVYWFMFIAMKNIIKNDPIINNQTYYSNHSIIFYFPNFKIIWSLFKLGFPIALSLFLEVMLFTCITLLIASIGTNQIIAHQIVLNISTLIFIIPLSLGTATSIRIGFYLGKNKISNIKTIICSSYILGIILSLIISIFLIISRNYMISLYSHNIEIIKLTKKILLIVAIYQIFDFFQIIGNGILRSYKDTYLIFIITCVSYWLIGFPCGYILALTDFFIPKVGIFGFWIGILISLMISSIMIIYRIFIIQKNLNDRII